MSEKGVKIDTHFQPTKEEKKKRGKRCFVADDDDRISQLPDDVLVNILSLLSLKEAGRTSVLSSRWINLWKQTPSLDFNVDTVLDEIVKKSRSELIRSGVLKKYLKWVNSVLRSHKSPTLKQFRIRFPLDKSGKNSITRWIEFALSRQVQRLELDFPICSNLYIGFPQEFVAPSSTLFDFKSLKSLSFKNVNVSGETIEFFLHNCPLLERLTVHHRGKNFVKLEVCGPSLALKYLEILNCPRLESLKVSAPSLTSLMVSTLHGVLLENVPMLVDVYATCQDEGYFVRLSLSVLSCCISRLETLHLMMWLRVYTPETDRLRNFPEMPKLKKLVIEYYSCGDERLIRLASLARACPHLEEFILENKSYESEMELELVADVAAVVSFQHEHLKVFKFCGYYGRPCDEALLRYVSDNCVALEKIVIAPCSASVSFGLDRSREHEAAKKNAARHLQPLLPLHIELVVL